MPRELGASPYLSHWVTTHFSATGKPLQVTGILHSLGLQEKVEKAEKVAEIANVEMTTLRSRLNPHLLFNCLTGLRALISKDPQSAKEFTGKLANFLRSAVDTQTRSLIPLEEELALCRDYLSLETMRGAKLKAVFRIDRAATRFRLPPMSVHTLLENAVKHGKRTKDKMMTISVIAKQTPQKKLILKVIQPGRLKKAGSQRSGAGLLLLRQQLDLLFQANGQIRLIEDRPGFVTATLNIQMDETTS
jgi:LytS/YehU family sensor histidine kinase